MSFALFRTTLKLSQWTIVSWAVLLVLYGLVILLLYPTFKESAGSLMEQYMRSLPEGILAAMGLTEDVLGQVFGAQGYSLGGWLGTEYMTWWPVIAGIYAFIYGSGIIAKEMERGTMELLLSHPIPRYVVLTSKFVGFLAIAGVLVIATVAGIGLGALVIGESIDLWRVSLLAVQGGMAIASIAAYSLLVSCLLPDPRKAMIIAGAITAALYVLNLMGPILDSFSWIQKLSLFYYFRPMDILVRGKSDLSTTPVFLSVTALCFAAALLVFQRRKAVV